VWRPEGKAIALLQAGKVNEAVGLLEEVIATGGLRNSQRRNLLGICYARDGKLAEAQRLYEGSLEEKPGDPAVLTDLGNVALLRGDPDRARELYLLALQSNVFLLEPRHNLVLAYQDTGHFEKCLRAYRDYRAIASLRKWVRLLAILSVGLLLTYALAGAI
jgi:Flp pilus assembly protein TadD